MNTPRAARRREVYAITQRTGARVVTQGREPGLRGTVVGHYDDDSVYVQIDGESSSSRWWTDDLELAPSTPSDRPVNRETP